jgi:hypothetical protein
MRALATIAVATALMVLAGCQVEPFRTIGADFKRAFSSDSGEPALAAGIRLYEEGRYAEAGRELQSAIGQGLGASDEVRARKYLAFMHCVSNRIASCREEFRRALHIDPAMELSAAEAGHPSWGPVFRGGAAGR